MARKSKLQTLKEWVEAKTSLAQVKPKEMVLRHKVVGLFFNENDCPTGTNYQDINEEWRLKYVKGLNTSVDPALVAGVREQLGKLKPDQLGGTTLDKVIVYKPEFKAGEYKKLGPEAKAIVDECLLRKPASPSLEMVAVEPDKHFD